MLKWTAVLLLGASVALVQVALFLFEPLVAFVERHFSPDGVLKDHTRLMLEVRLYGYAGLAAGAGLLAWATARPSFRDATMRLLFYDPRMPDTPAPRTVLITILVITASLLSISLAGQYLIFVLNMGDSLIAAFLYRYFNLDREHWVPTTFAFLILLYAATMLANVTWRVHLMGKRFVVYWGLLSLAFVYLAIDDGFRVHEWLFEFLRPHLDIDVPAFWVVPAGAVTLLCVLAYLPFLLHLPWKYRLLFSSSGAIYLAGALGWETVSRAYANQHGLENFRYELMANAEEVFEKVGVALFIFSLQSYLRLMSGTSAAPRQRSRVSEPGRERAAEG